MDWNDKDMAPMEAYLYELTANGPTMAQVAFHPGVTMTAGALDRGPHPGLYKLGTGVQATANTPGDFKPGETIMADIVFEASAVMQVITFMEQKIKLA